MPLPPSGCGDIGMMLFVPYYLVAIIVAVIVGLIDGVFLTKIVGRWVYDHFPPRRYMTAWIISAMMVVALACVMSQLPYLLR